MSSHGVDHLTSAVGALLCVGIPGPRLDADTRADLERLQPGAIVLFRRNVGSPGELRDLCAAIHDLPWQPRIAIDHEGGRVMRVGAPFTHFPPAAAIGRSGDARLAYAVGIAMATELRSIGIDISFSPVLDVNSNPANPVIGDRSFGADPQLVAAMGVAQMRGLLDGGVLPCAKHFPGHGDTAQDSHLELPFVRRTRAELDAVELLPFRAAIAAAAPMIMSAHVVYPALDPSGPATMSRRILTQLLREELGFAGVIATDDLDMGAIAEHHEIGAAAVAIVAAGADLLLLCNSLPKAATAAAALLRATRDGVLSEDRLAASARRLAAARARLSGADRICDLPNSQHQALADRISAAS